MALIFCTKALPFLARLPKWICKLDADKLASRSLVAHVPSTVTPFWLIGSSPLQGGVDGLGVVVVLVAAGCVLAAGAVLAERRDLQTP